MSDIPESSSAAGGSRKRGRPRAASREPAVGGVLPDRPDRTITYMPDVVPVRKVRDHPLLRFDPLTDESRRLQHCYTFAILQQRSLDYSIIRSISPDREQELRDLLGPRWTHVLSYQDFPYQQLTMEFFCTYQHVVGDFAGSRAVSFSLGRRIHYMSVPELGEALGFYSAEESRAPEFSTYVRGLRSARLTERVIDEAQLRDFWVTIADGPYAERLLESAILDPLLRYVHRIIASSILGRQSGSEKVNRLDLLCLYCIVNRIEVNFACLFLASMARGVRTGKDTRLFCGPYISRLAQHLGVFTTYPPDRLTPGEPTESFTLDQMRQSSMVVEEGPPAWMPTRQRAEIRPPPAPRRLLPRHERGVPPLAPRRPRPEPFTIERVWDALEDTHQLVLQLQAAQEQHRQLTLQGYRDIMTHLGMPLPAYITDPPAPPEQPAAGGDDAGSPAGED